MGQRIYLGKEPASPEERRELIARKVAADETLAGMALPFIQKTVIQFLIESRGFDLSDCVVDSRHTVTLADGTAFEAVADILVAPEGRSLVLIKCVSNSLESWERYCVAFCRAAGSHLIPLAVITDSESVRVMDALTGRLIAEDPSAIPSRKDASALANRVQPVPLGQAMERERRILYAFDAIRCSTGKDESSL